MTFLVIFILIGGMVCTAAGQDRRSSIWWTVFGLLGLIGGLVLLFVTLDADTNKQEQACRDRGGEVVHYGRYGNSVDCINVPEGR